MNHPTIISSLLAALCSTSVGVAQTYASVPSGLLNTESGSYSLYFGSRDSMRCQILNSDHVNNVRAFTEIAARLDGGRSSSSFPARSWSNVQLTMGEGSFASATTTFSQNLATNTKLVFNASMTWPATTGSSPSPSPWGTEVKFPFSSAWVYTGTLANNAAWTGYSYYYLDGAYSSTSVGGSSVNMGTNNCLNTPHTSGPFCVPVFRTHAKNTGNPTKDDKFEFNWWLYRFPANTLTAFALSFSGSTTGVNIGNPCNNYFLGSGPLLVVFSMTPSSNSGSFMFPSPPLYAKYDVAAVGARIFTQAAYTEPTRNQFELTRAGYSDIGLQPVPIVGTNWLYATSATATTGGSINQSYIPVLRLAY
jgi:hypothetical protein